MTQATTTFDGPIRVATARSAFNPGPVGLATAGLALGAVYLASAFDWRHAALFLVGGAAGLVLYHAAFGFTSAWRVFIADARGAGLRAQMLMLAATCVVFFPALGAGQLFGHAVRGSVSPVSVGVVVGAFLFGMGMQLGGGCASGTLYTAGGGNTRMLVTLASFIAGSVVGIRHMAWWDKAPALKPMSLVVLWGTGPALAASLALFAAIWWMTRAVETRVHGGTESRRGGVGAGPGSQPLPRLMRGPWPLAAGALGLAAVNVATLWIAGRPWGVTSAFALWGSKALAMSGVDVASWPYWKPAARAAELKSTVFNDITSLMNFGIMLGALAASGLAGRFAPVWRAPARSIAASVLGGLMLGYGARIAYGCNIGAYFSGIASSSVHGWLWLAAAFAGSIAGTYLRPVFGLAVEGRTT
jgi:uncharacterized membrane protein YedE/YeeE